MALGCWRQCFFYRQRSSTEGGCCARTLWVWRILPPLILHVLFKISAYTHVAFNLHDPNPSQVLGGVFFVVKCLVLQRYICRASRAQKSSTSYVSSSACNQGCYSRYPANPEPHSTATGTVQYCTVHPTATVLCRAPRLRLRLDLRCPNRTRWQVLPPPFTLAIAGAFPDVSLFHDHRVWPTCLTCSRQ